MRKNSGILKPWEFQREHDPADTLTLDLQLPRWWQSEFQLFQATEFVVVCCDSLRKLIHSKSYHSGTEWMSFTKWKMEYGESVTLHDSFVSFINHKTRLSGTWGIGTNAPKWNWEWKGGLGKRDSALWFCGRNFISIGHHDKPFFILEWSFAYGKIMIYLLSDSHFTMPPSHSSGWKTKTSATLSSLLKWNQGHKIF